jgi:hypothetical protein
MPRDPDEHVYKLALNNEVHEAIRKFLRVPDERVSTITTDEYGRIIFAVQIREPQ